jgi:membrane-associated phospholipid phosphatase
MIRRLLLVLLLCGSVPQLTAQNTDIAILRDLNGPINTAPDVMMRTVSNSVGPLMIGIPAGLLIYQRCKTGSWTEKKEPWVIGVSLVASSAITVGLKYAVNRPRPFVTYTDIYRKDAHAGPYSFPSGHTSSAFALATSLSLCYPEWYIIAPAYLWAGAVGYSRMYLGVHYPSDVLVGALIGSGSAIATYYLNRMLFGSKTE